MGWKEVKKEGCKTWKGVRKFSKERRKKRRKEEKKEGYKKEKK